MSFIIKRGDKVRFQHDDGWGSPGCVVSSHNDRLHIYWPDDDAITCERPADLVLYRFKITSQPHVA